MSDQINHPSHYLKNGRECIDVMIEKFGAQAVINFCECNEFKYLWRAGLKEGNSAETDRAKAAWYRKKAEELRGNAMSSGIKPLSENVAQQLADAIEESNKAQQELNECLPELTDNIFRMVEDEIAAELLINTRRLATASFLTRRYWKRKVEKSKAALEETHKEFDAWRKVYHK